MNIQSSTIFEIVIDFVTRCLLKSSEIVCTIDSESNTNYAKMYSVDDVYICVISTKLNLAQAGQLTETVNKAVFSKFICNIYS